MLRHRTIPSVTARTSDVQRHLTRRPSPWAYAGLQINDERQAFLAATFQALIGGKPVDLIIREWGVLLRHSLAEIVEENRRCYGYRRLKASLARQSVIISEKVVQRLMKQEQLVVARPRRRHFGSYLGEISPAPENLINRDFHAEAPNVKWLTDITEFQSPVGKVRTSA
jgi:hypothetical protein